MASPPQSGSFDHCLIDPPQDDLVCSICLLVLCEPVLTSCCGNHFCRACVEQVQRERRPCPLCNSPTFSTMLDKYFVRKVNELSVACPQKKNGCPWVGSLGDVKKHLDPKTGDCKFMIVECSYLCGARVHHCELDKHHQKCPRRPYVCKFCDYRGVYEDMSVKHWKVCDKYPLPCPNHCGEMDIQRRYLKHHLNEECPLQKIECEFAFAGCQIQTVRTEMPQHMTECMQDHLSLVSRKCLYLCQRFPDDLQRRFNDKVQERDIQIQEITQKLKKSEKEVAELQDRIEAMQEELDELKSDSAVLKSVVFVPPFEFVMTAFQRRKNEEEQWLGPSFYSHVGGYQLCVSVDANGSEDGAGTHISVYVNLMKGEFDDHLRWPFRGSVTLKLLNQRKCEGAFEETILFTHDVAKEVAGRVLQGEVAESGLGIPKFIKHSQLGYNAAKNIEYLRNDCLRFCISKIEVISM